MKTYRHQVYPFKRPAELGADEIHRYPVVVAGAGPVGLTLMLDLVRKGVPVILLDEGNQVSNGSRAICFSKRSLEIFDRLGAVQPMRAKGLTWNTGRVFYRDKEVYSFNLLPEEGHGHPAFINLQQYYVEEYLLDALQKAGADIRWQSKVTALEHLADGTLLTIATPEGDYRIEAGYVLACDGSRSTLRGLLGLDQEGRDFEEKFLIADIVLQQEQALERWFWFDPLFAPGQSVLLHRQPDNMIRLDFRLGKQADAQAALQPERIRERVRAMLGADTSFELEWSSVYSFQSRCMERFVQDRIIFAGDAAHLFSPFGARGANSGIQDADNLAWKLHLVLQGKAPPALLHSYDAERVAAARENQAYTGSSTAFIAPEHAGAMALRNAVLTLASTMPHFRPLINSGRLSTPAVYSCSPLSTPDSDHFESALKPGSVCADAPVLTGGQPGWLLPYMGDEFRLICYDTLAAKPEIAHALNEMRSWPVPVVPVMIIADSSKRHHDSMLCLEDCEGLVKSRYDLEEGTCYLVRPDQHIAGRWRRFDPVMVRKAVDTACMLNDGAIADVMPVDKPQVVSLSEKLNITDHDTFYGRLCDLHQGLDAEASALLNSRLVLLLANEVGDARLLDAVLKAAKE